MKTEKIKIKNHLSPRQLIIYSFIGLISVGTLLLMMPFSTASGTGRSFFDALFTATSASCVTGLVVQDTATYWSVFGQVVILILIQIGGMGVVTIALALTVASGRKIGLGRRSTMREAISAPSVGGIVKMTEFILKGCFLIESLGALCLSFVFIPEFGLLKGVGYSIFHSISAFCNAGFDLMGTKGHFSSLTSYSGNVVVNLTAVALILVGGLGFFTWADLLHNKFSFKKYRMQTKVILFSTRFLIIVPFMYFFVFEFSGGIYRTESVKDRILCSLFRAVTPRTAGFNTADYAAMGEAGQMITIVMMLIGGCPGSTAGGMKITTPAVMLAVLFAVFDRRGDPVLFGRRVNDDTVKHAATIFMMYITLFITAAIAICVAEGLPMMACLFETASAIGTVGLSLGLTTVLSLFSRIILIILMFMGRVGGLTLVFAALRGALPTGSKYPLERITVG